MIFAAMAETGRKYRNPPVIEALCEIFFTGSIWDETMPGRFYDAVSKDFPTRQQKEMHEAEVAFSPTGEARAGVKRLQPRMQFLSADKSRLIQLGRDLVVVNQLRQYPRFENWEPLIYEVIKKYRELAEPQKVNRIGIRYINKIVIPKEHVEMEDYFTVYPHLPKKMGDIHGPFMIRFELPSGKPEHITMVTFGSAPSDKTKESSFLLDLYDIFNPVSEFGFDDILREVGMAHKNIEMAFEGSITDKLRELFDSQEKRK